jgi:hypothetical protein
MTVTGLLIQGALSDERTSLSLPANSFSGPRPMGLETIFYCLSFETFLFVAFYDSKGYDGGIRPRLYTGCLSSHSQSQSHVATDGQVVSQSCFKTTHRHGPYKNSVYSLMLTVSAGMSSCRPATGCVTPFIKNPLPSNGRLFVTVTQKQVHTLQY